MDRGAAPRSDLAPVAAGTGSRLSEFPWGHEHLVEYLAAEVLSALPGDLREFVVRTSVLERLSASSATR